MQTKIKKLIAQFHTSLQKNKYDLDKLMILDKEFLGKKGILFELTQELKNLPHAQKSVAGKLINFLKQEIIFTLQKEKETLKRNQLNAKILQEEIDPTLPAFNFCQGSTHPLNQIIEKIEDLFLSLGYEIKEGNEIETLFYNFEMLNMGKGHPAREMQDSFYIDSQKLLRTHTSNIQVKEMKARQGKPLKIISSGKVYRKDDDDATHSHQFMQLEGLVIDKNINFSVLKETLLLITKELFGNSQEIHLRPSYFPFTEPSIEVDLVITKKDGTKEYLEILGAGLVHPQVLKNANYDPEKYQGFAFGIGIERIAMIKYQIENIRYFYANDIRFLKQFARNADNENY
ncbi:phenylalanyl-tRNA synthetase alpha chain [Aster yellows witches'-broom phytoplasma AYWB]|uniref:Phenylalanine--tRNA ligase alpha subunit n=2 Tax=16SrI (Aster yellows group) TaxID=3042590 RepID=SYFA_AYWBP|nr:MULTISPECIES: phenylalanine--tRNA ligase subunit alpha [16SrI (Aster yellows group)]Q2NJZ3.1 RecName: Full=Phenylalanine--tRNA ligase alpha subunit; AltName: Full=Phenylalanyl-tRNA synthetase alpha subunit; Short=PheRS [Aster yellows witches'-broom phytoplasma AYWB]ABC65250.1 phenylalanyl-tRNA synthetase alpha chain [Aster yellows witches'-broom phytoplasma AYWB]PEH36396.1 phenylalanine--tRNA ligase subunit alpha [New Jersey aster yellows phytoplasma]